jgi:hypothetical protein
MSEPCGALPRKCLFIYFYLFLANPPLEKYVRKFNPEEESQAVLSIHTGWQGDHGWAVVFKQGPRRCLLLDTVDGLSDDEVLWSALAAWATFQPRLQNPRQFPGKLFYPDSVTHIIHELWNHLEDLGSSPGFSNRTPLCQAAMLAFSQGLSNLSCDSWAPQPSAEAPEKLVKTANSAAISRLRPIADGPNQWLMHRSSAATDGSPNAVSPMVGTESGAGTGSMDTRVASGNPS